MDWDYRSTIKNIIAAKFPDVPIIFEHANAPMRGQYIILTQSLKFDVDSGDSQDFNVLQGNISLECGGPTNESVQDLAQRLLISVPYITYFDERGSNVILRKVGYAGETGSGGLFNATYKTDNRFARAVQFTCRVFLHPPVIND